MILVEKRGFDAIDEMMDEIMKLWETPAAKSETKKEAYNIGSMKLDIYEQNNAYYIEAEIPGAGKSEVKLNIEDDMLVITAEKTIDDETRKGRKYFMAERTYGKAKRSIHLPETADTEKINAKFENGVLTVSIPKKEIKGPDKKEISIQ